MKTCCKFLPDLEISKNLPNSSRLCFGINNNKLYIHIDRNNGPAC